MPCALYPGTFDPVTNGHIDIVVRASNIFPKVIAVVADNPHKNCMFSADERLEMVRESLHSIKNVECIKYSGLIVDCIAEYKASVIIRGLRALSDFDYEFQMAFTNRQLNGKADTIFLMPSAQYTYLSSTMVRDIARLHGNVSEFVTDYVAEKLHQKIKQLTDK